MLQIGYWSGVLMDHPSSTSTSSYKGIGMVGIGMIIKFQPHLVLYYSPLMRVWEVWMLKGGLIGIWECLQVYRIYKKQFFLVNYYLHPYLN